ncbi:MAG TPA: family 20 glycosylhydrolase [Bacteroidia bacterium]|nr:family 20 glycosylhydrolase [Bacteroidia bacterium]
MKITTLLSITAIFVLAMNLSARAQDKSDNYPLIPKPVELVPGSGSFRVRTDVSIVVNDQASKNDAAFLNAYLLEHYGFELKLSTGRKEKNGAINIFRDQTDLKNSGDGYRLSITPEKISLHGGANAGVFYGIQSLIQLLPAGKVQIPELPSLTVSDYPRYSWRGMHLDVVRHFFSAKFVKKYIDYIALYKMNTFHWHLTDDQGWRIEIKKYPELQHVSAHRKGTLIGHYSAFPARYDSISYGGYYTQEEIREIVDYASKRHINIVPEIEMPGHALAALAAYPGLSCSGGPFEVGKTWGVFQDVFCPKEETFVFLQNVLNEVCELFPGKLIHIGGDECPKDRWKKCAHCQQLMAKEGLNTEHELQSYFIHRIEKYLQSKGKKIIGWDEILEGGLAPDATVMSWRGYSGGIEAAKKGHDVVMTPTGSCYFDYYQSRDAGEPLAIGGYLPLERVYQFEPCPEVLNDAEKEHILGAQGNIWTEYIPSDDQVEYMAFPRMAALAEVLWSPMTSRNYNSFTHRLIGHFKLLDFLKVNYSKAVFDINYFVYPNAGSEGVALELMTAFEGGVIHYTEDGSEPQLKSPVYKDRIPLGQSTVVKAVVFDGTIKRGRIFSQLFKLNFASGKEVVLKDPPHEEYCRGGGFSLVNGVTGSIPWNGSDWLGFRGKNLEASIDLGRPVLFTKVSVDVLQDEGSWIYLPSSVEVHVSDDGIKYEPLKKVLSAEFQPGQRTITLATGRTKARYIKLIAENSGTIPAGKPGEGNPAWLFADEIMVE